MFPLKFDQQIRSVTKIQAHDFTDAHREALMQARFQSGSLSLPDSRWATEYLGAGEEKAVFCICDPDDRVFAVELLDGRTYLNGRFVGGQYFFDLRIPGLSNVKLNPDSEFGLMFTGKVKVREFVHGYEWARFRFDPRKPSWLDGLLTSYLRSLLSSRFNHYRSLYQDVHDRNVLFELRAPHEKGIALFARNRAGQLRLVKVRLQPLMYANAELMPLPRPG